MPNIIDRMLVETCVYWAPTDGSDNSGQKRFASPVELLCRWVEKREVFTDRNGNMQESKAKVRVRVNVEELGVLWYGTLATLVSSSDPFLNTNAYEIRYFCRIPKRQGDDIYRYCLL